MSTFDKVAKLISSQLGIDKEKVKPESLIVADLGADSIDVFEMVMALEDELGIEINEDKVQELKTVQDVVNIIENN
ncbi:MAG TPA: acyl carrier protein [Clostridiales bacterium]|nr:acyl carrier protein [Clostridiales bacterium]